MAVPESSAAVPAGRVLRAVRVPLASLAPDPANARTHPQANVDAIVSSLRRFGQAEPLIVQAGTRRVIAGHGRLQGMKALGWTECDVVELDVSATDATALGVALNRTAELAEWDDGALAKILEQLRTEDGGLDGVGFSTGEIDDLLAQLEADTPRTVDDHGPMAPPVNPVARLGDLWVLGDHRLLCGDSTKCDDVLRLMGDEKAALVATDPPYLVDYTGERPNASGKDWSATYREIDIDDAGAFFRALFTNVIAVMAPRAAVYCWHAHKRCGEIQAIWRELGLLDHQQIIWVKPSAVFGRVYWHFRHEPCVMGWLKGSQPTHDSNHEYDSVWEVDWEGKSRIVGNEHPTQKPVELFARPMRKHTKPGDVCYEPCSGSGSQLIAAESLHRRCRAMEISPAYVDVAVRRWETATGRTATLDGKIIEEVAAARGVPIEAAS